MVLSQFFMLDMFKRNAYKKYQKFGKVKFAISQHEQEVTTIINGEVETKNIANKGDYVIEGVSGEFYVLTPVKFIKYYVVTHINPDMTGEAEVVPQSRFAAEWHGDSFVFVAPWKTKDEQNNEVDEVMICNTGDYLVSPEDLSEVYRIEKETFLKTYELVEPLQLISK